MSKSKERFYLPISQQVLDQIIADGAAKLEDSISNLAVPQMACLLLLQNLPMMQDKSAGHIERKFAESINFLNTKMNKDGLPTVRVEIIPVLEFSQIVEGSQLLPNLACVTIGLLSEEHVKAEDYLDSEGNWDFTFNKKYHDERNSRLVQFYDAKNKLRTLTDEQSRVDRLVKTQPEENLNIQGYAGTGKSLLVTSLISTLQHTCIGAKILILSERDSQIKALRARIGSIDDVNVFAKTFTELSREIIPQDLTNKKNWYMYQRRLERTPISDEQMIKHLGITPIGGFSSVDIVQAARSTLAAFCYSDDETIQQHHVVIRYRSHNSNQSIEFDDETKRIITIFAEILWQEILSPSSKDFVPLSAGYHRLKWIALNGWVIPIFNKQKKTGYTHVIIDESHDLSKPILQILDRSPQVIISLGDEHQSPLINPPRRSDITRGFNINHSVRSGRAIEEIINPIIQITPNKTNIPFHGNELNKLNITYYSGEPKLPEKPAAILVSDMWGLFEWTQRAAAQKLDLIPLLPPEISNLKMFVSDCIELYHRNIQPRHGDLFRLKDWGSVAEKFSKNPSFKYIDELLQKGYDNNNWQETLTSFKKPSQYSYLISEITDARNRDFQTVMVVPQVIERIYYEEEKKIAAIKSDIYVAITRARHALILPSSLRNWIEDISARHTQSSSDLIIKY